MDFQSVYNECGRYHENMFFWLAKDVFDEDVKNYEEALVLVESNRDISKWLDETNEDQLKSCISTVSLATPGRFGEMIFRNKREMSIMDIDNEPRRFYPEQFEAIDFMGDLIISAGAGAGKTWMVSCKSLWVVAIIKSSVLIVTHSNTARNEIFDEMMYQIGRSDFLEEIFPPHCITRGNDREIRSSDSSAGSIRFKLSGDGSQVLSIHIGKGGWIFLDEAAMYRHRAWPRIMSRAMEGCKFLVVSVPCGKQGNEFDVMFQNAIDLNVRKMIEPSNDDVDFARVTFDRERQPSWTAKERARSIRDYGPMEGSRYKAFVNGIALDRDSTVFSTAQLTACFIRIPMYRSLKIAFDEKKGEVRCSVSVCSQGKMVFQDRLVEILTEKFSIPMYDRVRHDLAVFDITTWVLDNIPPVPVDFGGIDGGKLEDPNIFHAFEDTGVGARLRWSVETMCVSYVLQSELINGLLQFKGRNLFNLGLAFEASSASISMSIWESLRHQYNIPKKWISPFSWMSRVELTDKEGKDFEGESPFVVKRSLKHHLTLEIQKLMNSQVSGIEGSFELPSCEQEMLREYKSHSGEEMPNGDIKYAHTKDHRIEADRVAIGRLLQMRGSCALKIAAVEAIEILTTPRGMRKKRKRGNA